MATETVFLPGFGIIEDEESGDTFTLPGGGVAQENAAAAGALNNDLISAMHLMRPWEPTPMGT